MDRGNAGIECKVRLATNEPEHIHPEVELLFVLDGSITVSVTDSEFLLEKDDIIVINSNKWHYITVPQSSIILNIKIPYDLLQANCNSDHIVFWCNTVLGSDDSYAELRSILQHLVLLELNPNNRQSFERLESCFRILNHLTKSFLVFSDSREERPLSKTDETVQEILLEIEREYCNPLNMADIATEHYLSPSTLSRLIKKAVGMSFPDYVNRVRIRHAVEGLLNSNKSITDIATGCGFSTPSVFNRVFRTVYNDSPTNYRKKLRERNSGQANETLPAYAVRTVERYLDAATLRSAPAKREETVIIRQEPGEEFRSVSNVCVNAGSVHRLGQSMMQDHIRLLAKNLHLKYVRLWNVFSPDMISRSPEPNGNIRLNFHKLDSILNFLNSISVYPYLDISSRPDVAVRNGGSLVYRKEEDPGFKNRLEWETAMRELVDHLLRYYGAREVNHWLIEFTKSPQNTPCYPDADYYEVFDFGYRLFKESFPECRIGGCAYALDDDIEEQRDFYQAWGDNHIIPDFFSVIVFPYSGSNYGKDIYEKKRVIDEDYISRQIHVFKNVLSELQFPSRPVYVAELSSFLSSRNFLNDHCHKGTAVLQGMQALNREVDMLCYWAATDLLSLFNETESILFGGNGLLTKDGIRKPSYYALYFLTCLESRLVSQGLDYIVTRGSAGEIAILCWNFQKLSYRYLLQEENLFRATEVDSLFENGGDLKLRFQMDEFDHRKNYILKCMKVGRDFGSILNEWKNLGYEKNLRSNDVQYLERICVPHMRMSRLTPKDGIMEFSTVLKPHEIQLIQIFGYRDSL